MAGNAKMNGAPWEKADRKEVEAILAIDHHIRKVERIQTLVACHQAGIVDVIVTEKGKAEPDQNEIARLRGEISKLDDLGLHCEEDQIDQTLATLKTYEPVG